MTTITDLVEDNDLELTKDFPYLQYPFEKFNRVQSTIIRQGWHNEDCNLVQSTSTSTGKTISAELFMSTTLAKGGKVVYVSPLKSLTTEKFDDWKKTFPSKKIGILSSDSQGDVDTADILCVTSEILDSRSRKVTPDKNRWIVNADLLILDEAHILASSGRGHAVEAGLVRFCFLNKKARLLLLSATMPNAEDIRGWIENLTMRTTHCLISSWRPTKLNWNFMQHKSGSHEVKRNDKIQQTCDLLEKLGSDKALIFVHDKKTGALLKDFMKLRGLSAGFHFSDVPLRERRRLEDDFCARDGSQFLISTSTLAWGRNTPARHVVIVGVHRGQHEVDILDIQQMAGRAGRLGWDSEGDVWLICDNVESWQNQLVASRHVKSTLLDIAVLGFHILAEIMMETITNKADVQGWFSSTLAGHQLELPEGYVDTVITNLKAMKMIEEESGHYSITNLGRISGTMYFRPEDIAHWAAEMFKLNKADQWNSTLHLSWLVGSAPGLCTGFAPGEIKNDLKLWMQKLKDTKVPYRLTENHMAFFLYKALSKQGAAAAVDTIIQDAERIQTALLWISKIRGYGEQKSLLTLVEKLKAVKENRFNPARRIRSV